MGECTVDVALREVHAPGARRARRITPKSMGVLLVLVENAGRMVARDALLARVWPDTLPTNDVVTQAITQLRKALGQVAGGPQYIETIAKSGYRLLASVEHLPSAQAAVPALAAGSATEETTCGDDALDLHGLPLQGGTHRDRPRLMIGTVATVLLLAMAVLWARSLDPARSAGTMSPAAPLQAGMITSAPGFELAPTLSPDAAMVAYMAVPPGQRNIAIMVQTTAPTAPRQLTRPPDTADDGSPHWSPDGREIAFLRVRPGQGCTIIVIPANGGAERSVGACDRHDLPSFDWTPDGGGLIFSSRGVPARRAGLQILDLRSGDWTPLEYAAGAEDIDLAPRYSPDGRWIVFVRNSPIGDFWRVPAAGGTAERLTDMSAEIRGWDWAPGGQALIYGRRNDSQSRLYRFDLRNGANTDLGVDDGEYPVVAAKAPALAYVHQRSYFGIHRVDLNASDDAGGNGERLFASSGRDRLPAVAPDDRQLVFASDRSGEFGLWWADLEQRSLRLLAGVRPESRHLPSWSPDSRRVLVQGIDPSGQSGIFEVVPGSGQVSRLPIPLPDPVHALYSGSDDADTRLLVIADGIDGIDGSGLALTLFDRSVDPWRALATIERVSLAQADPVGKRVVFTRPGTAGLWQSDLQLSPQSVRRLDGDLPATSHYQAWSVAADGAIYITRGAADCPALLFRKDAGEAPAQRRCLDRKRRAATTGFSISSRTGEAFVSLALREGGDIGFVALDQRHASATSGRNN